MDDEVLYGVFVAGDPSSLRKELPLYRSALCIYPMADVEEVFKSNIMDCYQGIVLKQLPWFKSSDQCKATRLQWKDVACGKDVNANIGRQFLFVFSFQFCKGHICRWRQAYSIESSPCHRRCTILCIDGQHYQS